MENKFKMSVEQNIFVANKYVVDSVWRGATFEGINVTYPETEQILNDIEVTEKKPSEITTIINLNKAWQFVTEQAEYGYFDVNVAFISQINKIVNNNLTYDAGEIRTYDVRIGGTDWKPDIPKRYDIEENINKINQIENVTERAITMMLYLMRTQVFSDGNKRTSMFIANYILISNGAGILIAPNNREEQNNFSKLIVEYYETNNMDKIKKYVYNNLIDGINFPLKNDEEFENDIQDYDDSPSMKM